MSLEDEIADKFRSMNINRKEEKTRIPESLRLVSQQYNTLIANLIPDIDPFFRFKNVIIGFGHRAPQTRIRNGFRCSHPENIYFLGSCFVNYSCTFLANDQIVIGNNVSIGPNVGIYTIDHQFFQGEMNSKKAPVYIEDYSWIGGGSIILRGVKIGKSSIIGAGSVVTRSTEEGYLYAGVPAKKIKRVN